jgi:uncharacterized protein YraI
LAVRSSILAAILLLTSAASAFANPVQVCNPPRDATFSVTGVARTDRLNLRAGPSTSDRVVTALRHDARNIRFDGSVSHSTTACRNACFAAVAGIPAADLLVASECTRNSNLWYRVRDANGNRGWAAARFLSRSTTAPAPTPPPAPPVATDERLSFRCEIGGTILLITRVRTRDAVFYDGNGREWTLIEERGMSQRLAYRGMDNNREMFLRGNRQTVTFSDNRGRSTACTGIR